MKTSPEILMSEAADFLKWDSMVMNVLNPQSSSEGKHGKYLKINGQKKLDLTRLDYLGLGSNPKVGEIMIDCIRESDVSCPASQMVMKSGATVELEKTLASFHGMTDCMIFTSGYTANENIIQALGLRMNTPHLVSFLRQTGMGKLTKNIPTVFFVDSESHFSLQRGARLSKSQSEKGKCFVHTFPSADYPKLMQDLEKYKDLEIVRIIISDTLSSSSGRLFDVKLLCELAEKYDCLLYLDEAHAVGAIGPQGRGVVYEQGGLENFRDRMIIMGTLTKVFCQLGGYVTVPNEHLAWFLRFCSPHYLFSAPVPPWMARALVEIIGLIRGSFGDAIRKKLENLSAYVRHELIGRGFNIMESESHIIPVFVGNEAKSDQVRQYLEESGYIAASFKYPAVSKSNALVRISLCADINGAEVEGIIWSLERSRDKFIF